MPTPQFENFRGMIDRVLTKYPLYDPTQIKEDINDSIRAIIARRAWSGLMGYGQLQVPAQYATGTITTIQNSQVVTGQGTTWPVADVVNTTLANNMVQAGIVDVQPTSLSTILPGQWLCVDGGNTNEESVFVISTDPVAGTFQANFQGLHVAPAPITCSSFSGRQIRSQSNTPFLTITGVTSATRLRTDVVWPYASQTATIYEITQVFFTFARDFKEFITMVNPDRQYSFELAPKTKIDVIDPRRAVSQMPYMVAFHAPDPGGVPLYELWPRPTSQAAYPFFYIKQWAPMVNDYDLLPNGIRSDVVIKLVKAEAASWPGHKRIEGGIYYDLGVAERYREEAEKDIQYMKNEDDSTALMQLVYAYKKWRYGGPPPDWYQTDIESYFV